MDLIYMNSNKEDIGVLKDYTFDLEFGSDQNNFECTVNSNNHVCEAGYYLYYEGAEYGGIIDSVNIDTESKTVKYIGRTWHGIIESKILQPDIDADYLIVSGEANTVIASLVSRMGIGALFKVSTEASGINISSYKMNRYVGGYTGIMKMLKKSNAKLDVAFKKGFVELSTSPLTDYSQDEQFDTDQISFTIQKNYKPLNHVICLGQGDLKDRRVIHVFADALGNISGTQTLTGLDEVCATYDNSNAESDDELKQGGFDMIAEAWASDSIDFNFTSNAESFDINDVIGAKELTTDTIVTASITKKIVKIVNNTTTISYECEGNSGTISSGSYPSSGTGGGPDIDVIDNLLSESAVAALSANQGRILNSTKQDASTAITTSNIGSQSVNYASSAGAVAWGNVSGKPSTYTPSSHTHDDRYYTESEMNTKLNAKANSSHTHDDRYYTESEINTKINWNNHMKSNYTSWGTTVTINTGKKDGIGICFNCLTQATVFRVSGTTLALSTKDLYGSGAFSGASYNSSTGVVTFTSKSNASMAIFFISNGTY